MKIIQLVEQTRINSALDLKNAFDETQWTNIIIHFNRRRFTQSDQGMFDTAEGRVNALNTIQRRIGFRMQTTIHPSDWQRDATSYNMAAPESYATWQDIYDHLAPWKDEAADFDRNIPQQDIVDTDGTPERVGDIASWARPAAGDQPWPETFESVAEIQRYLTAFNLSLSQHRDESWISVLQRGNDTNNPIRREWIDTARDIYAKVPITKRDVDFSLLGWLNYAGKMIRASQERDQNR